MSSPSEKQAPVQDVDLLRWQGYKKAYDMLAGHAKERWQCGYNVLQMFLRQYCNVDVPLYTLQLYLRKKARAFKEKEGEIANLTPEGVLRFGEFTQLEDMAAYVFGIKPFSDEFNDVMYYPALMSVSVGGSQSMTVEQLFANEGGKYTEASQECKDARQTHLACVIEEAKYKTWKVGDKEYSGAQIYARDYEGKGYILKGPEFDKVRSRIAVDECRSKPVKVGGTMTTVSQLFSYEYDKKVYEDDRRRFAEVFYSKVKNYFDSTGTRAGIPVVFNAMIYLIVDATMDPEPSVFLLDPHDMTYLGDKFREKKKKIPLQYILGSPTGATLFFPPGDPAHKDRLKKELEDPDLLKEARVRFCHLAELALFNKETYLRAIVKKNVGDPPAGLEEFFRLMENFGDNVFENAILEETCRIFNTEREKLDDVLKFTLNIPFSFDTLIDELSHHFPEFPPDTLKKYLIDLFKFKNVFVSLPSFVRTTLDKGLGYKNEMLWQSCVQVGNFINIDRINSGLGAAPRQPFRQDELQYYTYIFRGLLFLFNSQDRYSHVELVNEFYGPKDFLDRYYILAALGEGLVKGVEFRNVIYFNIVENGLVDLAERIHRVLQGSVQVVDMSIDRFLKLMEKGETRIDEHLIEGLAKEFETTCNYLYSPLEGVLFMVDKLKNRMKNLNIIKRQLLVAISGNIAAHADLKSKMLGLIKISTPELVYEYDSMRERLMEYAKQLAPVVVKNPSNARTDIYTLPEGALARDPARAQDLADLTSIVNQMRLELGKDLNLLQQIIDTNVGKLVSVEKVQVVMEFNELFKLEGSKDTEFASKINQVYNEVYEKLDLSDEGASENISPLIIGIDKFFRGTPA
ncbi:MAG: hypothetical protein JW839_08100 [Candidatus Lokiarchaeota archaeon]|nr:hypothetical protein [Candidatus Lokiarchaeota archaeon]